MESPLFPLPSSPLLSFPTVFSNNIAMHLAINNILSFDVELYLTCLIKRRGDHMTSHTTTATVNIGNWKGVVRPSIIRTQGWFKCSCSTWRKWQNPKETNTKTHTIIGGDKTVAREWYNKYEISGRYNKHYYSSWCQLESAKKMSMLFIW